MRNPQPAGQHALSISEEEDRNLTPQQVLRKLRLDDGCCTKGDRNRILNGPLDDLMKVAAEAAALQAFSEPRESSTD
jgi:hypothetical protein